MEFLASFSGMPDYVFKILVIGNSYVGKSSYLMRLCNSSFSQRYSSTIGQCEILTFTLNFHRVQYMLATDFMVSYHVVYIGLIAAAVQEEYIQPMLIQ